MKKQIAIVLALVALALTFTACKSKETAAPPAADETYTYTYTGNFGEETAQILLKADGTAEFNLPGNEMLTDVYAGTFTRDGDTVTITGLKNKDSSSSFQIPGLWQWIDGASGNAKITVNADGTFKPAE
jgi:hypothetical protein